MPDLVAQEAQRTRRRRLEPTEELVDAPRTSRDPRRLPPNPIRARDNYFPLLSSPGHQRRRVETLGAAAPRCYKPLKSAVTHSMYQRICFYPTNWRSQRIGFFTPKLLSTFKVTGNSQKIRAPATHFFVPVSPSGACVVFRREWTHRPPPGLFSLPPCSNRRMRLFSNRSPGYRLKKNRRRLPRVRRLRFLRKTRRAPQT